MKFIRKEDFLKCIRNELVPENPQTGYGIEGLLSYRINSKKKLNKRHPDSLYEGYNSETKNYYGESLTAKYFKEIYGENVILEGSSDTIFNCWSFLLMFARGRLGKNYVTEDDVLDFLGVIFEGHETLRQKFDILANYQHSMANFMPAPYGYNGTKSHDGKGAYDRDNDMPDIYYQRAQRDFPEKYKWINDNKEKYALNFFMEYESGYSDRKANKPVENSEKGIALLEKSIDNAIKCIENRATRLCNLANYQ